MNTYHFSDIAEANEFWGWPAPEHPLLSVLSVEPTDHKMITHDETPITISDDFYSISLKTILSGEILYGRTKYDFKKGTMLSLSYKRGEESFTRAKDNRVRNGLQIRL